MGDCIALGVNGAVAAREQTFMRMLFSLKAIIARFHPFFFLVNGSEARRIYVRLA